MRRLFGSPPARMLDLLNPPDATVGVLFGACVFGSEVHAEIENKMDRKI
jgi:hypothetical protein